MHTEPEFAVEEAVYDERVMFDGRPAFAWHSEIQMLRREVAELKSSEQHERQQALQKVLGIVAWQIERSPAEMADVLTVKFTDGAYLDGLDWQGVLDRAESLT